MNLSEFFLKSVMDHWKKILLAARWKNVIIGPQEKILPTPMCINLSDV